MLSFKASGIPLRRVRLFIPSTRVASASSSSWDQSSVAFKDCAARSRFPASRAMSAARTLSFCVAGLTCPPWRRGEERRRNPLRTLAPARPAVGPAACDLPHLPAAGRWEGPAGMHRGLGQSEPRPAAPRNPRSDSSARPGGPTPSRPRRAPRAWRRGGPLLGQSSCALPFTFEPGVRHQELLYPNLVVIERHRHLEIATGAGQTLDRAAAEAAVPNPLAFDIPRAVLRGLFFRGGAGPGGRRAGGGRGSGGQGGCTSQQRMAFRYEATAPPPRCPAAPPTSPAPTARWFGAPR